MEVNCPHCHYQPDGEADWDCAQCGSPFDMFAKAGHCTSCGYRHEQTPCIPWKDGCAEISPHLDWYSGIDKALNSLGIYRDQDL